MKKEILFTIFVFFLLLSINLVLAETEFWQEKQDKDNGTIQNHLVLFYSKGHFGITDDYISGNNPYEVYFLYNIYVQKWNNDNPNYRVSKCDFIINYYGKLQNTSITLVNVSYNQSTADIMNGKYFVKLFDGDGVIADEICYFENESYNELYLPAEMQIVTPSWECKACQFYEWSLIERDVTKAQAIGDNVVVVSGYIKKLFLLNFETWLALFWLFLILMIFVAISFIFVGVYWLYLYLNNIMK